MLESKFQSYFTKWLKNVYKKTGIFELKVARGNTLPFSKIPSHQWESLWHAKHKTMAFKIPDCGFQNPCDCFCLAGIPAYVVVLFGKNFYLIDIDRILDENEEGKSLSEEKASKIGEKYQIT